MSPTGRSAVRGQGHHLSAHKEIPLSVDNWHHQGSRKTELMAFAALLAGPSGSQGRCGSCPWMHAS